VHADDVLLAPFELEQPRRRPPAQTPIASQCTRFTHVRVPVIEREGKCSEGGAERGGCAAPVDAAILSRMKTLGLIGGTTWHSTIEYYRAINAGVHARLGGLSSARLILYSVNFEDFRPPVDAAGWARVAADFASIARRLEGAGADCVMLCANTPHTVAGDVERAIGVPLLHIADCTGDAIHARGLRTVGLLGTRPTMELGFLKDRLAARGITSLVPDEAARAYIHGSILDELGQGIFTAAARARYLAIMGELAARGAEAFILGCTEIPLLIKKEDCELPLFDTGALHAAAGVAFALGG
jgi:aspartate racemase